MSLDTEGGREVVKIDGWRLWAQDVSAEESGVIPPIWCNNSGVCDTQKRLDEFRALHTKTLKKVLLTEHSIPQNRLLPGPALIESNPYQYHALSGKPPTDKYSLR